jgi:hypothetical protein
MLIEHLIRKRKRKAQKKKKDGTSTCLLRIYIFFNFNLIFFSENCLLRILISVAVVELFVL